MSRACDDSRVTELASVVERYYAVVADRDAPADALRALLHPDVRIVEHPNAINPKGTARGRDEAVTGYLAGKELLSEQTFDVHEILVSGDRVAVRATWQGKLARDIGGLPAGMAMKAHIAALLTVVDGQIREHETFDCYEPLVAGA